MRSVKITPSSERALDGENISELSELMWKWEDEMHDSNLSSWWRELVSKLEKK